ncbi:response regulator [bacterium]|nr:response regulator [bacterium]
MAKKILIAEDEEILYSLLKQKLVQQGYEVSVVKNGKEALEQMRKEKPDLLLLDIIMPEKGGFEVMEEMQKDPSLKDIPIVIISNSGQPVEIDKAKRLGAKDWVIKTEFDPQEVMEKVKKEIG